jgi:hypothetical protein
MRLSPELIKESLSYINPLKERELDLRGWSTPQGQMLHLKRPELIAFARPQDTGYLRLRTWE